jgi:chromosome segregation ATPase
MQKAVAVLSSDQEDSRKATGLSSILADFYSVSKRTEMELVSSRKKLSTASRERESLYSDLNSERQVRVRLESVCKEISNTNAKIEEELTAVKGEEEAKREECKSKMERTLTELNSKLDETETESRDLRAQNDMLKEKMEKLLKDVEERDKYYTQLVNQKDVEIRMARLSLENTGLSIEGEHELQQQLQIYQMRFSEFEDTLTRSDEAFGSFRKQKADLTEREAKLKSENEAMQKEAYSNDVRLVLTIQAKEKLAKQVKEAAAQRDQLKEACRQLQLQIKNK